MAVRIVFQSNSRETAREIKQITDATKKADKSAVKLNSDFKQINKSLVSSTRQMKTFGKETNKALSYANSSAGTLGRTFRNLALSAASIAGGFSLSNTLQQVDDLAKASDTLPV